MGFKVFFKTTALYNILRCQNLDQHNKTIFLFFLFFFFTFSIILDLENISIIIQVIHANKYTGCERHPATKI